MCWQAGMVATFCNTDRSSKLSEGPEFVSWHNVCVAFKCVVYNLSLRGRNQCKIKGIIISGEYWENTRFFKSASGLGNRLCSKSSQSNFQHYWQSSFAWKIFWSKKGTEVMPYCDIKESTTFNCLSQKMGSRNLHHDVTGSSRAAYNRYKAVNICDSPAMSSV